MRSLARTRRKEVESECRDSAGKEAGQQTGDDTGRGECLRETVKM